MNWYWRVRIYNNLGMYAQGQIITGRNLQEIDGIQEFYFILTGCKMLIEGMGEEESMNVASIQEAFSVLWQGKK